MIEDGKFYFIKDSYFQKINDKKILLNKESGNKRPCYYCFKDKGNPNILWLVPISSKIEKYKKIYKYKLNKYGIVDTIVFGKVNNDERAFLIQNIFPVIEKYIETKYTRNNMDVEITFILQKEIEYKANLILSLAMHGKKVVFTDVKRIKKILEEDLKIIYKYCFCNSNSI